MNIDDWRDKLVGMEYDAAVELVEATEGWTMHIMAWEGRPCMVTNVVSNRLNVSIDRKRKIDAVVRIG